MWDVAGRKEMLFSQIISAEPNPVLTNQANIKPDPRTGKGGVMYDKKKVWVEQIIKPLMEADEFKGATWPADHQAVINVVDRIVKANRHLFKAGMEQAEPAAAGTDGKRPRSRPYCGLVRGSMMSRGGPGVVVSCP
jgi:hypothetical protein